MTSLARLQNPDNSTPPAVVLRVLPDSRSAGRGEPLTAILPRDSGAFPPGGGGGAVDVAFDVDLGGECPTLPSCLDPLQSFRNKPLKSRFCCTSVVQGQGRENQRGEVVVGRVHCKSWGCDYCAPKRAKQYKRAIQEQAEKWKLTRLLTLTVDPKKIPAWKDQVRYINQSFAKLRTIWKRKFGVSPKYIRILEFQQNGRPHFHLLIDRYMEWAWIKEAWSSVGGGCMVDVRHVDIHNVTRYLSKYLTKQMLISAPKWCHRVTAARGITLIERKKGTWEFFKGLSIYTRAWWVVVGYGWKIKDSYEEDGELDRFTALTDYGAAP